VEIIRSDSMLATSGKKGTNLWQKEGFQETRVGKERCSICGQADVGTEERKKENNREAVGIWGGKTKIGSSSREKGS